jgi:thiol-disulfide isomerase/thioredoxin
VKFVKHLFPIYTHQLFSKKKLALANAKKEYQIAKALLHIISNDSVLGTAELRSLDLIIYLTSNTSKNLLSTEEVNACISQFEAICKWPYQKEIAQRYQLNKLQLASKTEAPLFCLNTKKDDLLCLKEYRKRHLYLGFIHTQSTNCQRDLLVIENFAKKYRKMNFLFVITDKYPEDITVHLPEASNIKYVYLNHDYQVLESYQALSYPVYFLIDPHGYLIESPAARPSEMGQTFMLLTVPKNRRKSYEY